MSIEGSSLVPNNWEVRGAAAPEEQSAWYETMLAACEKRSWVEGMAFWSWGERLYPEKKALERMDYDIFGKPAERVVKDFYERLSKKV